MNNNGQENIQSQNNQSVIHCQSSSIPLRASYRSSIQSISSINMQSSNNLQSSTKGRGSLLTSLKSKLHPLEQQKQNEANQVSILQEKMQNVSCLYSNFIYKNTQKNFIDDMKLERYRIMVENERVEKNQLLKEVEELKTQITNVQKEKSTVMFAYRTLEERIKERERQIRLRMKQRQNHLSNHSDSNSINPKKQKLSINMSSPGEINGSMTSVFMQGDLLRSRELLTSQGILNFNDEESLSQRNLTECFNKLRSSKEIGKYLKGENGIRELEARERKFVEMEKQLVQMNGLRLKLEGLKVENSELGEQKTRLSKDLAICKEAHKRTSNQLTESKQQISTLTSKISELTTQVTQLEQNCSQLSQKCSQYQKQFQLKQSMIEDLQNTKYSYLMKQEKQKQQIEVLKKFTQNLQLSDEKINDFIQTTFGNKVQNQVTSQNKLFKQDISYILHLIKKKENIYNELIKEYQEKHRETETRTFMLEKRLHLTDIFIKKLDSFIEAQIQLCQTLRGIENIQNGAGKKIQNNKPSEYLNLNKFIQALQALLENYHLDRRII